MSTSASASASASAWTELPQYQLRSDLAQYCLPAANRDETRNLAWANSICLVFIAVACLGLRQPVFIIREAEPLPEPMAVVVLPPVEQDQPRSEQPEEQPEEDPIDQLIDSPSIAPVVVAAPDAVNFSVPVEGFITLAADARFVPPPPPVIPKAPPEDLTKLDFRAIRFGGKEFKRQPPPDYPAEFQRNRIGGTVEALITVGTNGIPLKVDVGRSSGAPSLDRHVCDFIRREWRADPGAPAAYRIAITFAP